MGTRILVGEDNACLYCSVTDMAFGPLFEDEGEAEDFLAWLMTDPRKLSANDLIDLVAVWRSARCLQGKTVAQAEAGVKAAFDMKERLT